MSVWIVLWFSLSACVPFCLRPRRWGGQQTKWRASGWLRPRRREQNTVKNSMFCWGASSRRQLRRSENAEWSPGKPWVRRDLHVLTAPGRKWALMVTRITSVSAVLLSKTPKLLIDKLFHRAQKKNYKRANYRGNQIATAFGCRIGWRFLFVPRKRPVTLRRYAYRSPLLVSAFFASQMSKKTSRRPYYFRPFYRPVRYGILTRRHAI